LELDYFEICDQENVEIVSLKDTPIEKLVPNGVKTTDGRIHECDALIMATGFDSITGGLTQMDIRGVSGQSLAEKWSNGVYSL
nr:hypothetical protein [Tanacetum cinerariifolium]